MENSHMLFRILRKSLEEDFEYHEITKIAGSGSSPAPKRYIYIDEDVKVGKHYYYKLGLTRENGNIEWYGPVSAVVPDIEPFLTVSPNPFTTSTAISLILPSAQEHKSTGAQAKNIELKIYDMSGRLVKDLSVGTGHRALGTTVSWDGRDNSGNGVPPCVYFVKLKAGGFSQSKKIILLK